MFCVLRHVSLCVTMCHYVSLCTMIYFDSHVINIREINPILSWVSISKGKISRVYKKFDIFKKKYIKWQLQTVSIYVHLKWDLVTETEYLRFFLILINGRLLFHYWKDNFRYQGQCRQYLACAIDYAHHSFRYRKISW